MSTYSYRRDLKRSDRMKALGIGIGAGAGVAAVTAYLAGIFLRRTPLREPPVLPPPPPAPRPPRPPRS